MELFNNTTLFTGYIKQLLHSFNLPKYRIYTKENQKYFDEHAKEDYTVIETVLSSDEENSNHMRYIPYIKDGFIQEYINGK